MRRLGVILVPLILGLLPGRAGAYDVNGQLAVYGHVQLWLTAYEQMQEADGLLQFPSRDPAANWTSGFSLGRARLGAELALLDGLVGLTAQVRLERNPNLLDLHLSLEIAPWLTLVLGQQKAPGPGETLRSSRDLDFIFRPTIAEALVDYSLSRTTFASSLFYGVHSYLRDFGIGLEGAVDLGRAAGELRYRALVANGLGANLFIGAVQREFILTNMGQFYWGGRLELARVLGCLTLGGHLSVNHHDNMVFNSGRVVIDLKRHTGSADLLFEIPGTGLRFVALVGSGEIRDDYDNDGRVDLRYLGWAGGLLWSLAPILAQTRLAELFVGQDIQVGARYDYFASEWNETSSVVAEHRWTIGLNYAYAPWLRLQVNYVIKQTRDPSLPELADDILVLSAQAGF